VSKVDTEPYVSWNKGHFSFDDYTLEKIMNVLSEWYEMKVIYKSNDIKNIHFTGTFNRYSSVRPVLNAMMKITNLDIQIKGSNIVLDKIQ
jgi:transmembrane sensor